MSVRSLAGLCTFERRAGTALLDDKSITSASRAFPFSFRPGRRHHNTSACQPSYRRHVLRPALNVTSNLRFSLEMILFTKQFPSREMAPNA